MNFLLGGSLLFFDLFDSFVMLLQLNSNWFDLMSFDGNTRSERFSRVNLPLATAEVFVFLVCRKSNLDLFMNNFLGLLLLLFALGLNFSLFQFFLRLWFSFSNLLNWLLGFLFRESLLGFLRGRMSLGQLFLDFLYFHSLW